MEHDVRQRSEVWFSLRKDMVVTASRFADAVGAGRGKPYDFLHSLLDEENCPDEGNSCTRHGIDMEPVIHEAYTILTGYTTRESGFWTMTDVQNPLKDYIGGSPDAIVLDPATKKPIGLCEFKAPVYTMYRGIPRQHMIQMQGQMAVSGLPWCDYMAMCKLKKDIILRRVYFCPQFWDIVARKLLQFCQAHKELTAAHSATNINGRNIQVVKQWNTSNTTFPFEQKIQVTNLLQQRRQGDNLFCGPSAYTMNFDLLMGSYVSNVSEQQSLLKYEDELERVDEEIEEKSMEAAMIAFGY